MYALKRSTHSRKTGSHNVIIKADLCVKGVAEREVQVLVEGSSGELLSLFLRRREEVGGRV